MKEIAGLDLGEGWLRWVQLRKAARKLVVTRVMMIPVITPSEDQEADREELIVRALKQLLQRKRVHFDRLVTSIPRHLVMMRSLTLPSTNDVEIARMVQLEVPTLTPWTAEEMIVDYLAFPAEQGGYSRVLAFLVQREIVEEHLSLLKQANLEPDAVSLSSFACFQAFHCSHSENSKPSPISLSSTESPESPRQRVSSQVLINLEPHYLDISVIRGEQLVFTRGVMVEKPVVFTAPLLFAEAKEVCAGTGELCQSSNVTRDEFATIVEVIKHTVQRYSMDEGEEIPQQVFLSGSLSCLDNWDNWLAEELNLAVVKSDPFSELIVGKRVRREKLLPTLSPALTLATGLALDHSEGIKSIDFLPPQVKQQQKLRQRKHLLITRSILGVVVTLLLAVAGVIEVKEKREELSSLLQQINIVKPTASRIEERRSQIAVIKEELNPHQSPLEILAELYRLLPPAVTLNMLLLERGKFAVLRGQTEQLSQVFQLSTLLADSLYFSDVQVKYTSKRKIGGSEQADFEIRCRLSSLP